LAQTPNPPRLIKLDGNQVPDDQNELRLFSVMRNESLRLPAFLKYYKERGVRRFFIVDNGSTDGMTDLLMSSADVHVFHTNARYSEARSGIFWIRYLLDLYGCNHWCIAVDADELLVYPHAEYLHLSGVCDYLSEYGYTAVGSLLLDMYSAIPFADTKYTQGGDILAVCPYYDANNISQVVRPSGLSYYTGGVRRRLFGINANLTKVSLFRYLPPMEIQGGMHGLTRARFADIVFAVLHFKFLYDFPANARREALRQEHWRQATEYKAYNDVLVANPQLCALAPLSHRLQNSMDLVGSKLMRTSAAFEMWAAGCDKSQFVPSCKFVLEIR
jgi:hypothetical protein